MAVKSSDEILESLAVRSRIRTTKVYLSDIDEMVRGLGVLGRLGSHERRQRDDGGGGRRKGMMGV